MKNYTENDIENEFWKDIPNYEGLYKINTLGEVRSMERKIIDKGGKRQRTIRGGVKKQTLLSNGYYAVGLWKNNKQKLEFVHRLIAMAFIPNPENLPEINHIDGNKTNNNIENLEWCTQFQNMKHAFETGLIPTKKKVLCKETGIIFESASEAAKADWRKSIFYKRMR